MASKANAIDKALQKFFASRLQYVNCLAKNEKINLKEPSEKTLAAVAKQLTTVTAVGPEVATSIVTAINDSCLTDDAKDRCIELLHSKVTLLDVPSEEEGGDEDDAKQEHNFLPEYTQKDLPLACLWESDRNPDVHARLRSVAKLFR